MAKKDLKSIAIFLGVMASLLSACEDGFAPRSPDPAILSAIAAVGGTLKATDFGVNSLQSECPTLNRGSSCSPLSTGGAIANLNYRSCRKSFTSAVWSGSEQIFFSGGSGCSPAQLANLSALRTFGASTELRQAGVITTLVTASASTSGWDSSIAVGNGMRVVFSPSFPFTGARSVAIDGLHISATERDQEFMDQTLSSATLAVERSLLQEIIRQGALTAQDNLRRVTSVATITEPLVFSAECCLPVAGKLTVALSGSVSGQEVYVFESTCGRVTKQGTDRSRSSFALNICY